MRITPSKRALEILNELGIKRPPVDVEKIGEHFGIKINKEVLPDTVSGMLQRDSGKTEIYINSSQHLNRQRFTLGHELGHFFLNHTQGVHVDKVIRYFRGEESSMAKSPIEIDANRFAAEILMPEHMVRDYLKANSKSEAEEEAFINKMAAAFEVSSIAMTIRLQNLGIKLAGY